MQEKIREVLSGVIDPNTGKDLVSSKALKKVTTEDGKTTVQIELDYPAKTQGPVIEEMVRAKLVEAGIPADVKISQNIIAHEVQRGVKVLIPSATSLPSPAARAASERAQCLPT